MHMHAVHDFMNMASYSETGYPYPSSSSSSPPPANNNKKDIKNKKGGKKVGMKLSTDPQSIAARQRRHRISDRFRILKSLVPGGSKMDTVTMLEEAIHYVKFLKAQIWLHQAAMSTTDHLPQNSHANYTDLNPNPNPNPNVLPSHHQQQQQQLVYYSITAQGEEDMLSYLSYV